MLIAQESKMSNTKNIFISHIHKDDAGLPDLIKLLRRQDMVARNYSITSDKENNAKSSDYIKYKILKPRIDACSVLVVYITPFTKDSKWVNWEIQEAYKQGKRIVGVWERGSRECAIPEALEEVQNAIVGWNSESIVAAINGEIESHFNPDGSVVNQPMPITRHPCN